MVDLMVVTLAVVMEIVWVVQMDILTAAHLAAR